jgi:hypothetical protein
METEDGWKRSKERKVNIAITLNLPSNQKFPTEQGHLIQQLYMMTNVESWGALLKLLHESDYILGREFYVKKKIDGSKFLEDRGEVIINCQLIGKIKPFFE